MTDKTGNVNTAAQEHLLQGLSPRAREANLQFYGYVDSLQKYEREILQERADTELTRLQMQGHRM